MVAAPSALVWEVVKKNNAFIRKGRTATGAIFSAEAGNLTNQHSYKASGLANGKTIDIQAGNKAVLVTLKGKKGKKVAQKLTKGARKTNAAVQKVRQERERGREERALFLSISFATRTP
jgi:hypothetical protein